MGSKGGEVESFGTRMQTYINSSNFDRASIFQTSIIETQDHLDLKSEFFDVPAQYACAACTGTLLVPWTCQKVPLRLRDERPRVKLSA
jgi:hypothetical protein